MIKILFIRSEKAFLPEIDAYVNYFNNTDQFSAYDSLKLKNEYKINDFDVIWEFKGFGGIKIKNKIIVHEYASLSTGILPKFKNYLKSKFNHKPNLRIFLNENVKRGFYFNDNIDYCYRDMGIDKSFIEYNNNKEYEFVYIGSISKSRGVHLLLREFKKNTLGKLCLIGNVDDEIYRTYKYNKNLIFTGKVNYNEVPKIASKAVYGINFIPNIYPYNIQTSTKLLEYLALNLKVITTEYKWVNQFEKKYNCKFYKLDINKGINIKDIENFDYKSNFRAEEFLWEKVIDRSGIKEHILSLYCKKSDFLISKSIEYKS